MTPPAATAAGRALPRTTAGRIPRRVSGPTRPARGRTSAPPRGTRTVAEPFAVRALRRARSLSDSRFLDRLVRGRLWIPIVATALMGIVAMQVSMLKMNAGISRAVDSAQTLERQNAVMRADVSALEAGSRVDAVAQRLGMVQPNENSGIHFLEAGRPGVAEAAAREMTAPTSAAQQATTTGQTVAAATATQTQAQAPAATTAQQPAAPQTATTASAAATPQQQTAAPAAATQAQTQQQPQQSAATAAPAAATPSATTGAAAGAVAAPTAGQG